jgi:prophage antirepressor-like protein
MSEQITPFIFKDQPVRTVERDGEPWFVGKDVCRVLEIENDRNAFARLGEDEKGVHTMDTLGGPQTFVIVSEPGVYRLVFTSRKAEAEEFKRWLAHEVLPQIRKTGRFAPVGPVRIDGLDETALALVNAKLELVREYRRAKGPVAASQMWTYLGLPEPTARGAQATPAHSGAACLAHLLVQRDLEGRTLGRLLEAALNGGDFFEEMDLGVLGVRIADEGVIFANGHHKLVEFCAGTPWANGRWNQALKRLPGARAVGAQRFSGVTCRGVYLPADVVLDAAMASDPR